ncbi:MAG: SGNH/GDSL hydrolase family protein [Actinomycetes bacterium]
MSRASRARRIAAAAAFGGGGLTALGVLGLGVVTAEVKLARRWIGQPFGQQGPQADGIYGAGSGKPLDMVVLGDSSAAGLGADLPEQTPGAILASGLAAFSGRRVRLTTVAVVGAESGDLANQLDQLREIVPHAHVAVIMVGANDVTHRVKPAVAVRALARAVTRLRETGAEVVVGTCPDLGTVEPIAQPLRSIARRLSREMAAAQTIAVVEAGGRSVSLGDVLGPEFEASPHELFSEDRFHPSAAGYARCASVLLPSVYAAAGYWPDGGAERAPERRRGEGVAPVAHAAVAAADDPGTEVAATRVAGDERGNAGRWAMLLRRRREPLPAVEQRHRTAESASADADDETPVDDAGPGEAPDDPGSAGAVEARAAGAAEVGADGAARPQADGVPMASVEGRHSREAATRE